MAPPTEKVDEPLGHGVEQAAPPPENCRTPRRGIAHRQDERRKRRSLPEDEREPDAGRGVTDRHDEPGPGRHDGEQPGVGQAACVASGNVDLSGEESSPRQHHSARNEAGEFRVRPKGITEHGGDECGPDPRRPHGCCSAQNDRARPDPASPRHEPSAVARFRSSRQWREHSRYQVVAEGQRSAKQGERDEHGAHHGRAGPKQGNDDGTTQQERL